MMTLVVTPSAMSSLSDGRTLLGVGGSLNLEQGAMSDAALALLEEIGVDFAGLRQAIDPAIHDQRPLVRARFVSQCQ